MASLLHHLLFDIKQRCSYLAGELDRRKDGLAPEAESYRQRIADLLARCGERIDSLLADKGIQHPRLARNYYYDYKRLAELVQVAEEGPVLALGRFSRDDRVMTRMVEQICLEIGYPYNTPLCSATSAQYYWALPNMDLLFVPCSEPYHLLALPDLLHELAHIVLYRNQPALIIAFRSEIDACFDAMIKEAKQKNWATGSVKLLDHARVRWKESWFREFACDMMGTYWAGPAFGWSNVRLCTNQSADVFESADTHPADHARAMGIDLMLKRIGSAEGAARIDKKWQELISLSGKEKPQTFGLTYPADLLTKAPGFLVETCDQMGCVKWTDQTMRKTVRIMGVLNAAWEEFLARPDEFAEYERKQVEEVCQKLGLDGPTC